MVQNKSKPEVKKFSAFTQSGAVALAKVQRDKMGWKILTQPTLNPESTMWEYEVRMK